jgi:hypothetical protein
MSAKVGLFDYLSRNKGEQKDDLLDLLIFFKIYQKYNKM